MVLLKDEDDDDLFAPRKSSRAGKRQKAVTNDADLFGDDSDIFADISTSRNRAGKKTKPSRATKTADDDLGIAICEFIAMIPYGVKR